MQIKRLSSDYMMSHIDYDSEATTKRLGDALYENTIIRDSIFKQTGRRFLDQNIKNDNEQFKYLMDNAISASKSLQLSHGISLSKAQINALTQDIVWMEEKEIQGVKVLVPVVYIADADKFRLEGARIIASNNINIEASNNISNISGDIIAGEDMNLQATNDISNISGNIEAKNIDLTSTNGSVINKRSAEDMIFSAEGSKAKTTLLDKESQIMASNSLNINAAEDIKIEGSKLQASDITLNAKNVDITTTVDNKDFAGGDSDNYMKERSTTHLASNINADNISINAVESAKIKGSYLKAKENLKIIAKKLEILAVNNTSSSEMKSSQKGFFSSESTTTKKATSTNIASELNGKNIELTTTEDDIDVIGSNLDAKDALALDSAKDINIKAGYDGSMNEFHTKKSGFFTGGDIYSESEDLEGKLTKTAKNSTLSASEINLNSNNNINIKGSNLKAKETLSADAKDINIQHALNEEKTYSKHTKLSVGLGDVVDTITNPQDMVEFENGKFSATIAKATYDKETQVTNKTTVASSNLDATNIKLNASSGDKDSGNVLIEGSNLKAKEDITVVASNDITIKEAKETTDHESEEVHGKAELKVSVKNEYVQVGYALKAVKEATTALQKTKKDYDKYKGEVSKQEGLFTKLNQDYKNKVGFIELADVEEFRELLDDLKEDDSYYKANIVLATATLATKTTALIAQGAKAATAASQTLGTGFSAGLELDIDAIEKQFKEYQEKSVASNLDANNINLTSNNKTTIQGSNLNANENINIAAKTTDILASKDNSNSNTDTQHKNINLSFDTSGGPSASVSADSSKSSSQQTKYTNSNLQANNININTKETTTIKGATLKAEDSLTLNTKNLEVASVQETSKQRSHSIGISAGFGAGGLNSLGANSSNANSKSKQTIQTSLTANKVDINTEENTKLKGATIAALDADGNDNGKLNLKTETLTASSLNNTYNSKSSSIGIQTGVTSSNSENINKGIKDGTTEIDGASTIALDYSNDRTNSKTKTLATLGNGNIQIGNQEDSETRMLNRDAENNEVDIYNISSHKGLKGELDARLLTEEGRAKIAKDAKKSKVGFYDVAKDIINSDSLTILDSFTHQGDKVNFYDGMQKAIKENKDGARDKLADPSLTQSQKDQILREIATNVARELKIELADVSTISTNKQTEDGKEIQGGYHAPSGDIAINDKNINSTGEAIETLGHELAHSLDNQRGLTRDGTTQDGQSYSDEYAGIMGDSLKDYAEFGMWNYSDGKTLATTNEHNGLTPPTSVFDPNYNQATQNFENRVDGGEIDYRTREEAYSDQKQAQKYGVNLVVTKDKTSMGGYVAVPPERAARLASSGTPLTEQEKDKIKQDIKNGTITGIENVNKASYPLAVGNAVIGNEFGAAFFGFTGLITDGALLLIDKKSTESVVRDSVIDTMKPPGWKGEVAGTILKETVNYLEKKEKKEVKK